MANMDRENMAVDIKKSLKKRFDALSDWEQQAMGALMEARGYSIKQALDIVESGEFEFYPGITSLEVLAYRFIHEHAWSAFLDWDPDTVDALEPYIDYDKLGAAFYADGYRETSSGVVRVLIV